MTFRIILFASLKNCALKTAVWFSSKRRRNNRCRNSRRIHTIFELSLFSSSVYPPFLIYLTLLSAAAVVPLTANTLTLAA